MMVLEGAEILIFPGAFNMTTGPAHWELLIRSRALDNQCYCVGVSQARNPDACYVAYGHSMVADPGEVLSLRPMKGRVFSPLTWKWNSLIKQGGSFPF